MDTGWTEGSVCVDKLAARAASLGVKAAIGEYGYSDEAFTKDKAWLDRFIASAKDKKLLAVAYFDTQLNSSQVVVARCAGQRQARLLLRGDAALKPLGGPGMTLS